MYAQVITPGYRITLEAGGQTYAYHTSLRAVKFSAQPATFSTENHGEIVIGESHHLHSCHR